MKNSNSTSMRIFGWKGACFLLHVILFGLINGLVIWSIKGILSSPGFQMFICAVLRTRLLINSTPLTFIFLLSWSSLSSWWGSEDAEGVPNSSSWFFRYYTALWPPECFPWWKNFGCDPWLHTAVVMCWDWKGSGYSWKSPW